MNGLRESIATNDKEGAPGCSSDRVGTALLESREWQQSSQNVPGWVRTVLKSTPGTFLHLSACLCQQGICVWCGKEPKSKVRLLINAPWIYWIIIFSELFISSEKQTYLRVAKTPSLADPDRHETPIPILRDWEDTGRGNPTFQCLGCQECYPGVGNNAGRQQGPRDIALVDFLELIRTLLHGVG